MVAFAGSGASSVSAGWVMVVWGIVASPASISTVLYVLLCMLDFNPAISTAFLTAMTMGVCAVAVSKFSMYLNRFLWFSTLKFTPATMSKQSTVFLSVV